MLLLIGLTLFFTPRVFLFSIELSYMFHQMLFLYHHKSHVANTCSRIPCVCGNYTYLLVCSEFACKDIFHAHIGLYCMYIFEGM